MISKFPPSILSELKNYVYMYSHPITGEVFYVGKGKGNRVFSHLKDQSETAKTKYLKRLKEEKLEPKIEILIHGLDKEETALRVEAAIIDLIGRDNLTNVQKGYKSRTFGRLNIRQIVSMYQKEPVTIDEKAIGIRINSLYYPTIPPHELYDVTRSQWRISLSRAQKVDYAFAVYQGIIYEVYQVKAWFEAMETYNSLGHEKLEGRFEFIGKIAPEDIRTKYLYKSIAHYFKRGNANPIYYFNV